MAFAGFVCEKMAEKLIVYIIFMHIMFMKSKTFELYDWEYMNFILDVHGYLGCSNETIPCLNGTHCAHFDEVCLKYGDCIDDKGEPICSYKRIILFS